MMAPILMAIAKMSAAKESGDFGLLEGMVMSGEKESGWWVVDVGRERERERERIFG